MTYEYGKPVIGMALGDQPLLVGANSRWENWKPTEPEATATLWRYMNLAKFCSLLDRSALFFSLVEHMADVYEGFVYPPIPREQEDRLDMAERFAYNWLSKQARASLISCWTQSDHESNLMWDAYAGKEGVAVCITFRDLQEALRSIADLPVTFGQVKYVDYRQTEVPRFGWGPLFHKRMEYRAEIEVRAVLPPPPFEPDSKSYPEVPNVPLDPDVAEQRGRYVPVNLEILVQEVVLPPYATPRFAQVVESIVDGSPVKPHVRRSNIESLPYEPNKQNTE
ncbi:MAG: hypothetical protein F4045_08895 [Chloroflexi bacterium]|nr:hypothetical protein [Chloroflexota bacterium]MYK35201.1 hypothetical protein [Chloroflexota bacterium]